MPTHDAGRPIRSADLNRHKREAVERFQSADQSAQEAFRRSRMVALALRAREPVRPPEATPDGHYRLYRKPLQGPGAERIGPFVTARAVSRQLKVGEQDLTGTGTLDLLRPGAIWAETSGERSKVFEARLQPSRLMEINEIMVPHIAGQVSIELFNDRSSERLGAIEESRLIRMDEAMTFNGRVRIESVSSATAPGGQYIHCMGGLSVYYSDWAPTADLKTEFQMPRDGNLRGVSARLWPTRTSVPATVVTGDEEVALPRAATKGDVVEVELADVSGFNPASLVELSVDIA